MEKTGYFEIAPGVKSSSRLIAVAVVAGAFILDVLIIIASWGKISDNVVAIAASLGTVFTTIAGPVMLYLYSSKKNETSKK